MKYSYLTLVVALFACSSKETGKSSPPQPSPTPAETVASHDEHEMTIWRLDDLPKGAVMVGDIGKHRRKVTTNSADAQAWFDQGLALTYGFNHDEAARSFAKAGSLDPDCAMCWWGVAYALGPNYNMPMLPERTEAAWDALQRAQKAAAGATPVEQALVAALLERYAGPEYLEPEAMEAFSLGYAAAMRDVAQDFPDDDDVQVLFAEAMMDTNPWKLWTPDGEPAPGTEDIVATLEAVLARSPNHPGANHYYIHAVEASKHPEVAVPAADRLGTLIPAAGHLVHMPAHIYQRVGRYADASEANRRAIEADIEYLSLVEPLGYYGFYVGHNYGFLAYSSSMEGRSAESIAAARMAAEQTPLHLVCGMPGMDFFMAEPLLAMVRFGHWDEILAEPKPDPKYQVLMALWLHAHGMALAATGKPAEAKLDLAALEDIAQQIPEDLLTGLNGGREVLELAAAVLEARIAEAEDAENTLELWEAAVGLEDKLAYNEPADWFYPTRHYLGAALLDAGQPKQAIVVYEADLAKNPNNGWGLFGLYQAQLAAKQLAAAKQTKAAFEKAWERADIVLKRTAF